MRDITSYAECIIVLSHHTPTNRLETTYYSADAIATVDSTGYFYIRLFADALNRGFSRQQLRKQDRLTIVMNLVSSELCSWCLQLATCTCD